MKQARGIDGIQRGAQDVVQIVAEPCERPRQ